MTCDQCSSEMTIENAQTACDSGIEHTRWLCACGRRRDSLESAGPRALGAYWPLDDSTARVCLAARRLHGPGVAEDVGWITYDIVSPLRHEQRWFGGGPSAPPPPPPPPQQTDAEIQAEKAKTAKAARARKGRGASILTGEASTQFLQPDEGGGRKTLG